MGRLEGKVAIVFGAGPNIGGTIAHFLAREGAKVAVSDLNADAAEATVKFLAGRGWEALQRALPSQVNVSGCGDATRVKDTDQE